MTIVEITGGMLRAARSLTGLSQQELAERASISRPCLTAWKGGEQRFLLQMAQVWQRLADELDRVPDLASPAIQAPRPPGLRTDGRDRWRVE
jgi:transcriptional regulator with XRE-family HTH domain